MKKLCTNWAQFPPLLLSTIAFRSPLKRDTDLLIRSHDTVETSAVHNVPVGTDHQVIASLHPNHYSVGGTAWSHLEASEPYASNLFQDDMAMEVENAVGIMPKNAFLPIYEGAESTHPNSGEALSFEGSHTFLPSELTVASTSAHSSDGLFKLDTRQSLSEDGRSSQRSSVGTTGFVGLGIEDNMQRQASTSRHDLMSEQQHLSALRDGFDSSVHPSTIPIQATGGEKFEWPPVWDDDMVQGHNSSADSLAAARSSSFGSLPSMSDVPNPGQAYADSTSQCGIQPVESGSSRSASVPRPIQGRVPTRQGVGSTERYDFELPSTFPPTQGFWPPLERTSSPMTKPTGADGRSPASRSRSSLLTHQHVKKASSGRNRSSSDRDRPCRPVPQKKLSIVYEQCEHTSALAVVETASTRGKRHGRLDDLIRIEAAEKRHDKSVCIRCKKLKVKCPGGIPCLRCQRNSNAGLWGICTLFHFFSIVGSGSLNYISQRKVNHLTLDGSRRASLELPEVLDLDDLLSSVLLRGRSFNILVRQSDTPLYTLDLGKSSRFLLGLRSRCSSSSVNVRYFVDDLLPKTEGGFDLLTTPVRTAELLALQACWNNMPSRVTYEVVNTASGASRMLDVEDSEDQGDIRLAAQLSRIISRVLEVAAFEHLQARMTELVMHESKGVVDIERLVDSLGRILLTLRWRMAWWRRFGDATSGDVNRDRFVGRVDSLLRVLYFYYLYALRRMPPGTDLGSFVGVLSLYADAKPVFEKLPRDGSFEGFQAWLAQGDESIERAGVADFLSRSRP